MNTNVNPCSDLLGSRGFNSRVQYQQIHLRNDLADQLSSLINILRCLPQFLHQIASGGDFSNRLVRGLADICQLCRIRDDSSLEMPQFSVALAYIVQRQASGFRRYIQLSASALGNLPHFKCRKMH